MPSPHRSGYASNTDVPVERTKSEIESILTKHGATQRGVASDDSEGQAVVFFVLKKRPYRLLVPLPKPDSVIPKKTEDRPRGWNQWDPERRQEWCTKAWEQRCRSRWRSVMLIIRAKLEHVSLGMSTIEREFLADLMLPNGERLSEAAEPFIAEAVETGRMPDRGFAGLMLPARGGT